MRQPSSRSLETEPAHRSTEHAGDRLTFLWLLDCSGARPPCHRTYVRASRPPGWLPDRPPDRPTPADLRTYVLRNYLREERHRNIVGLVMRYGPCTRGRALETAMHAVNCAEALTTFGRHARNVH